MEIPRACHSSIRSIPYYLAPSTALGPGTLSYIMFLPQGTKSLQNQSCALSCTGSPFIWTMGRVGRQVLNDVKLGSEVGGFDSFGSWARRIALSTAPIRRRNTPCPSSRRMNAFHVAFRRVSLAGAKTFGSTSRFIVSSRCIMRVCRYGRPMGKGKDEGETLGHSKKSGFASQTRRSATILM